MMAPRKYEQGEPGDCIELLLYRDAPQIDASAIASVATWLESQPPDQREQLLRQIFEARLKAENTEFADRQETYNLAASSIA